MTYPIDQRPEHFAEMREGHMACAWCGAGFDAMREDIRCPKAPRTVHGVDRALLSNDPIYHKLVVQGRLLRSEYRADRPRRPRLTPKEFERLYMFTADDWAALR